MNDLIQHRYPAGMPREPFDEELRPVDGEVMQLMGRFAVADSPERARLRAAATPADVTTVVMFIRRARTLGLRDMDPTLVIHAATAIGFQNSDLGDPRDLLTDLGLLYHVIQRVGLDPYAVLTDVASMMDPALARLVEQFRDRNDHGLAHWGFEEVYTARGPRLMDRRGGPAGMSDPPPEPPAAVEVEFRVVDLLEGSGADLEDQVRRLTAKLDKEPNEVFPRLMRAEILAALGHYEAAVVDYEWALRVDPSRATGWADLAVLRAHHFDDLGRRNGEGGR